MKVSSKSKLKYGLFYYDTVNIGDEIQSIAARRFIPRVDYYINRDNIEASLPKKANNLKLIMNGWYIEPSLQDKKIHWPPKNPTLKPLLTSMHISFLNGSLETFKQRDSLDFLIKHAPVGARDLKTKEYLDSIGIPSFFSGCLTLTLLPDKRIKKSNFVLAVDVSEDVIETIKERTTRPVIKMNTLHIQKLSTDARFKLAQYWLTIYQSAHCIVTQRLHAMLPGLALGTPVISITGRDVERYSGLIELTNHYSEDIFIKNKNISIDKPKNNPTSFHIIRDELIKSCKNYTGFDSQSSYLFDISPHDLINSCDLTNVFVNAVEDQYASDIKLNILEQKTEILTNLITEKDQVIYNLQNPGIKNSSKALVKSIIKKINLARKKS